MARTSGGVVIRAPMSYIGSAKRLWKVTGLGPAPLKWFVTVWVALFLVLVAWAAVTVWYVFAVWLILPYRMLRRSQRRGHRDQLRTQELLAARVQDD